MINSGSRRRFAFAAIVTSAIALASLVTPAPDRGEALAADNASSTEATNARLATLPGLFGLGVSSSDPKWMTASRLGWTYRYQYLTGGVNTGNGWQTWNPDGSFATMYLKDSSALGAVPVFTYYQLLQSLPGEGADEPAKDFNNLNNPNTMRAYYQDFERLMQLAANAGPVIVHVEPDLSGYMQQRATENRSSSVPASVASSQYLGLGDLPNTYDGFGQALARIRDRAAPKVILATHVSSWGTGVDIGVDTRTSIDTDSLAKKGADFLSSGSGALRFDLVFVDPSDRDAGFNQVINGDSGAHWWDSDNKKFPNFNRFAKYLSELHRWSAEPIVLWQVPIGNTLMRSQNNTWNHFQDNRVQYWLDGYPEDGHLSQLAQAGVVAVLFGRGADGNTSYEDASGDGVTNPAPIGANTRTATVADDDGGYFRTVASNYFRKPLAARLSMGVPVQSTVNPVNPVVPVVTATIPTTVPATLRTRPVRSAAVSTRSQTRRIRQKTTRKKRA